MSRIGKKPITIPEGVTVEVKDSTVTVKGPKGELSRTLRPEIKAVVEDGELVLSLKRETNETSALWGTARAIIANMVQGVTEGYQKRLQIVGVGYRAKGDGNGATISIGYSHPVEFVAPEGIKVEVEDNTNLIVSGIDKQLVGLTAAKLRAIRGPEPYKGKGIKYVDEVIRRKAGKSGKVA